MVLSNTAIPIEYGAFRESVLRGEIPVNEEVALEMNRIDALIEDPEFYYDDEAINGFIRFCEDEMTLTDGTDLILLPSFRLWAECLLAWFYFPEVKRYNPEKHRYEIVTELRRLVNVQYLIVGRGAAKSVYAALLQAYFLNLDTSTTHQIVTAPTMKLAEETMSPIRTAISRARGPLMKFLTDGELNSRTFTRVKIASTKKGIENFLTNSLIEVRPMSIAKLQGLRSKVNTVDEWLSNKIKEDVIGAIEQGASKVDDYVIVATSSEGTARDGVGDTIKIGLKKTLRGEIYNPHVSIWHYKLDEIAEIADPDMWLKANPNIGITVSYDAYQRDVQVAENEPAKRNDILAKRFGIPVAGHTYFFLYEETIPTKRKQNYDGQMCILGADLSQGDDFCAFTFLFPLGRGRYGVKTRSYVSEAKVNLLPQALYDKYQQFVAEGTLCIVPGALLDIKKEVYPDLYEFIQQHQYDVSGLGYDVYNSEEFIQEYTNDFGEYGVIKVRQGVRTESVPLGELKIMAREKLLVFDEQLMSFTMGNSIVIQDNNGNYKLSKMRAEEKIDNVSALMDAWVAYKLLQEDFA